MRVQERYVLVLCFTAGFALTAGIALWRARDFGKTPPRAMPAARTAAAPLRSFPMQKPSVPRPSGAALTPPDPLSDYQPGAASTEDTTVDSPERLDAAGRRFARRGAAERASH